MRFEALDLSIEVIHRLRTPMARLQGKDRSLHEQIRRAASSVPMNLAEGRRRADEVRTALRVAVAWGEIDSSEVSDALQLLDRVLAMLWRLTH